MPNLDYRVGASRVAFWFVQHSKRAAKKGKTREEIIERLWDLYHCVRDWRDGLNVPSDESLRCGKAKFWENSSQRESLNGSKSQIKRIYRRVSQDGGPIDLK
jgi:hypothetical protein